MRNNTAYLKTYRCYRKKDPGPYCSPLDGQFIGDATRKPSTGRRRFAS